MAALPDAAVGEQMHALATRLYPICRSITGDGVRASLELIREYIPLRIHEVASGTEAFDWTVPKEWNIRDAYIANARGDRVVDFRKHNLHVVQYSAPVRARMTLDALRPRLHTLPEAGLDSVPHFFLQRQLGVLSRAAGTRSAGTG
jgi:aminopeptidase-like protein